jgi:hypothetical protein
MDSPFSRHFFKFNFFELEGHGVNNGAFDQDLALTVRIRDSSLNRRVWWASGFSWTHWQACMFPTLPRSTSQLLRVMWMMQPLW